MMDIFKTILLIQLFWGFGISIITYATPADAKHYLYEYSADNDVSTTISDVQTSLTRQKNIPLIEMGAIVYYSGNILIDLLINSLYAAPQMVALLSKGILHIFSIDSFMWAHLELFTATLITITYIIGLLQLLVGVRSGRVV